MCTYSAAPTGPLTGAPTDFHLAHYTTRAAGGAGLVMIEATGVRPEGRISPWDLGLWNDQQQAAFYRLTSSISAAGALPAIQLAHAGRKASVNKPWLGDDALGADKHGWQPVGPSPVAFPGLPTPHELSNSEIAEIVEAFAATARRALAAGFQAVEIHAAHGYLLHSFLSPLSNHRTDQYGGDLAGRTRIVLEVVGHLIDAGHQRRHPSGQRGQQPRSDRVQLANVPELIAAQVRAQRRGSPQLAERPAHPAVADQVHVADAVGPGHHPADQRTDLHLRVRTGAAGQGDVRIDQVRQPRRLGQQHHRHQPTGSDQIVIIELSGEAVGNSHYRCSCNSAVWDSQQVHSRWSQEHSALTTRPSARSGRRIQVQ